MKNTIIYQGIEGSFSSIVARKFFGKNNKFIGANTFGEIFDGVSNKNFLGVVPIENTIAGSVYENLDLLLKFNSKIKIIGEAYLKIEHFLAGIKSNLSFNQRIKIIKKAYSHPKALEQCLNFFNKYFWIEKVVLKDTAFAAKFVSETKDLSLAAICGLEAAKIYNLEIIKKNIEDNHKNFTRFLIIAPSKSNLNFGKSSKCSLIFNLKHKPGSLADVLNIFKKYNLNLTKIESRPIVGNPFEYNFFLDFEFNLSLIKIKEILKEVKKYTTNLIVLGFYPKKKWILK